MEKELKLLGFTVKIPTTARRMQKRNDFDAEKHKTWYKNPKDYHIKKKLIVNHFKKIRQSDAILVVNLEKNGFKGYIGGNTLMEMAIALQYKKPIYIYNAIDESLPFKEEIYGLTPLFLNQDLSKIRK